MTLEEILAELPLGRFIRWTVCSGPNSCYDTEESEANWATVYASLIGEIPLNGFTVAGSVWNRVVDPDWDEDLFDENDSDTWPGYIEVPVSHVNVSTQISTVVDPDRNTPAIELFGQIENNPDNPIDPNWPYWSLCGIVDGSYYIYPVVFPDARFCYLPRCSGTYNFQGEQCVKDTGWFPLEPYDPTAEPPLYPIDALTAFVPSSQIEFLFEYAVSFTYRIVGESEDDFGQEFTAGLKLYQTVLAPNHNWEALMQQIISMSYFGNGIYH